MYSIGRVRQMLVLGQAEHGRPLAQVHVLHIDPVLPVLLPLPEVEQYPRAEDARQHDVEAVPDLVQRRRRRDRHYDVREHDDEDTGGVARQRVSGGASERAVYLQAAV